MYHFFYFELFACVSMWLPCLVYSRISTGLPSRVLSLKKKKQGDFFLAVLKLYLSVLHVIAAFARHSPQCCLPSFQLRNLTVAIDDV